MRILYDSKKTEYKDPFGALKAGQKCRMTVKIPSSCRTVGVNLCLENDNTGEKSEHGFHLISEDGGYQHYTAEFSLEKTGLYFYHFFISTEESDFELYRYGLSDTNIAEGDRWQLTCYPSDFSVSSDFKGKVMYQIFPDRFYHETIEDTSDKLTPFYIHNNTDDVPDFLPDGNGKILNCDFFGGNFRGIITKLDYIKSLGTSVIYLNPIFKAYSNHRYDTCDYKKIDPLLGTEADFITLCDEAHKLGMKIILDGVFSHTGSNSIYFDKNCIFGNGAYSDPDSPYKSWYNFGETRDKYDSWWGIDTLPCVNELCDDYVDYIISGEDSVVAHWLRLGADGYRLDVADELPDEFIKKLRERVLEIKPGAYVVGEVWEDASNKISYGVRRKYFSDGELDSVMNYVFKNAIIGYVRGDITAQNFAAEITTVLENYPEDSIHSLMNSLSTHDTARILTCLSGSPEPLKKEDKAGYKMKSDVRRAAKGRLYTAVLLQYTLPGTACIYYGDEIGMEGYGDPFNRGYFKWDCIDEAIFDFFAEMGRLKNKYCPLQLGKTEFVRCDDVLIFDRIYGSEKLRIIINNSDYEYRTDGAEPIISHKVSRRGNKIYIQKQGFVVI